MATRSDRLAAEIRAAARQMGFFRCGFACAGTAPHAPFFATWLANGNAAGMHYLERRLTERIDPRALVPGTRTVILLGYPYAPAPLPPFDWRQTLRGRIAAYALGPDYHGVISDKLRELTAFIASLRPGTTCRAYVDTGPVLERDWAARAGIGWVGKSTNLLHPALGSYFFLGVILTDAEVDPDAELPDRCGRCVRCVEQCPTGALAPGYKLDARRCISYLTIEHRGEIPPELRPHLGGWIFGCDICQDVCPWNERLVRGREWPSQPDLTPYLPHLLGLDDAAFRRRFRSTAVWRARREGLLRNAAVALGNSRNPAAIPALASCLRHEPSALVRGHAAWALGRIGDPAARAALERARGYEPDAAVRQELARAREGVLLPSGEAW